MVWTGELMLFGSATNARADDRDSCYRNVQKWEQKLDRDIERHGVNSRPANHDRHESCQRRFVNSWREHHDNYRDYDHDNDRDRR